LRHRYALDITVPLFYGLRRLWDADPEAQPLLAMLLATARDPVLRASADAVLGAPLGQPVHYRTLIPPVTEAFPDRYNEKTVAFVAQRLIASWTQSGHLARPSKRLGQAHVRSRAHGGPVATAYALFVGHLQGIGGEALFDTLWTRMLDAPPREIIEQAQEAARQGWIELRRGGGVTSVGFPELERNEKETGR
jgi:hypothetical protein